jgi:hypothetical protein
LLKEAKDTWWNPVNTSVQGKYWLCVPVFSYKDRHPQDYVLKDMRLNNEIAFYIPSWYDNYPGLNKYRKFGKIPGNSNGQGRTFDSGKKDVYDKRTANGQALWIDQIGA